MRLHLALSLFVASLGLGCSSTPYHTFVEAHPDSWVDWPPPSGAGLHESLAGLYLPPRGNYLITVFKLDVIRLDETGPTLLSDAELQQALVANSDVSYGVVAVQTCRSTGGTNMYMGEKVATLVLPGGVVHAWNVYDFSDNCSVSNSFNPSTRHHVELERQVLAWRDARFPRSMRHTYEFYAHGVAYASKGRVEEARAMLAEGDATIDVGSSGRNSSGTDRDVGAPMQTVQGSDIARVREQLVRAIQAADSAL